MKKLALGLLFFSATAQAGSGFFTGPFLFSGESALNLTVGAPLSVSSTGKLTTGITTGSVNATATTTTASATDVLMTTMTQTPAAGTYFISFCGTFTHSANNATITYTLYAATVAIIGTAMTTEPTIQGGLTPTLPFSTVGCTTGFGTVNGSQTIQVDWKTSAATATVGNRILNILRVQ